MLATEKTINLDVLKNDFCITVVMWDLGTFFPHVGFSKRLWWLEHGSSLNASVTSLNILYLQNVDTK